MSQIGILSHFLDEIYQYDVVIVLQNLQLGVYSLWIGALLLLLAKLTWEPLDRATTYGKLLSRKPIGGSGSSASDEGDVSGVSSNSSVKASSVGNHSVNAVGWLKQRFAFTSSYLIGLVWALALAIGVFLFALGLQTSIHVMSVPPCSTLPSFFEHVAPSVVDRNAYQSLEMDGIGLKPVLKDGESLSRASVMTGTPEMPLFDSHISGGGMKTTYGQSLCSLWSGWKARGPSSVSSLFSESTVVDFVLFCLSNVALVRVAVLSVLLVIHLSRRLGECALVHDFSPRRIALHNLLLMWAYYLAMPLILIVSGTYEATRGALNPYYAPFTTTSLISIGAGIELFIFASVIQFAAHRTLASGRRRKAETHQHHGRENTETATYFVPQGGLFNLVSSPHYLAETCIYVAFTLLSGANVGSLILLAFNVLTMGAQALKTHRWYQANFTSNQLGSRKAFIPFIM